MITGIIILTISAVFTLPGKALHKDFTPLIERVFKAVIMDEKPCAMNG